MTNLFEQAVAWVRRLDPADRDMIALSILMEPSLTELRARLSEADAELAEDRYLDDCDALWEARLGRAERTIDF
ncbi:hypothetical protein P2H44_03805 [Albimonas sp. CAU 1670]|uniref:hypothetical protein n=1 Tax=Albimonas sp. CAU 1670 TaxID=3032599 RepID=UPI0023DB6B3B|nr:hypothetical protein [Albimonas sp. CAU 1670]MDF2231671.1 hypothetical protein [Albimonas sp. CAU 1670]